MKKKVKCISKDSHFDITIGKIYDVESTTSVLYRIIDDMGVYSTYYRSRFITVSEATNNESPNELFPIY